MLEVGAGRGTGVLFVDTSTTDEAGHIVRCSTDWRGVDKGKEEDENSDWSEHFEDLCIIFLSLSIRVVCFW